MKTSLVRARGEVAETLRAVIGTETFWSMQKRPLMVKTEGDAAAWAAWMLDLRELGSMQFDRLLEWVQRDGRLSYEAMKDLLTNGWAVPAADCEIVRNKPENFFAREVREG